MVSSHSQTVDPTQAGSAPGAAGPIAYTWRRGSGPTVVLVHGNTSDRSVWNPLMQADRKLDLLALDSRGHGASAWPEQPDYASTHYAQDIIGVIAALGIERPVLVGHSNGAISAFLAARALEPRPRALIWIDIDPRVPDAQTSFFRHRAAAVARVAPSFDKLLDGMRAVDPSVPDDALHAHVSALLSPADGGWRFGFDPRSYSHWQPADVDPLLRSMPVPTYLVRGAQSRVMSAQAAHSMHEQLPQASLQTIEGTGHWLPLGRPQALATIIRQAIDASANQ